jgi:hypothetical protein
MSSFSLKCALVVSLFVFSLSAFAIINIYIMQPVVQLVVQTGCRPMSDNVPSFIRLDPTVTSLHVFLLCK